ncbi:tetratricopeptide repeat protein, partial [Sinorhizobium fredii]
EWRALRELANINIAKSDFPGALSLYRQALALEQDDADLHANTGLALSQLGERKMAIEHYRRAILLNHAHAEAHNNLGVELLEEGELVAARDHIAAAFRIKADPDYRSNLREVERRLSNSH